MMPVGRVSGFLPGTRAERAENGKKTRTRVPRSTLGEWSPGAKRTDPVAILSAQEVTRVPELVPVRHERMGLSPFTFFRGAAAVFAADLASVEHSGITVQLCGDAHLANFGGFASPERNLVFDLNDFDETLPGPFEWDLARLAASFEVAARANSLAEFDRVRVQNAVTRHYCVAMSEFARSSHLQVWYSQVTLDHVTAVWGSKVSAEVLKRVDRTIRKARSKDNLKAFSRLTTVVDGEPRFVSQPPLLERVENIFEGVDRNTVFSFVEAGLDSYRHTMLPERRVLLERYRLVDLARKVVGVGSVGTRCWVALLVGADERDPLFLQVKEAEASVLEAHLGASPCSEHGERVVEGQRLIQSSSDIFLGWDRVKGFDGLPHDYYIRQLWDWKGSADIDDMPYELMVVYAQICGYTLARAHARTGDPVEISAYVGQGKSMARSMGKFAATYADQNERDHAEFLAATAATAAT